MALTRWLLDDTHFDILASRYDAAWGWTSPVISVVRSVAEAASDMPKRKAMLSSGVCEVVEGRDMRTLELFTHLRGERSGTSDLGEHEAIALVAHECPELVAVLMDKRAAYEALLEVGGACIGTPFDVWADLQARGYLDAVARQALERATLSRMQGVRLPLRYR